MRGVMDVQDQIEADDKRGLSLAEVLRSIGALWLGYFVLTTARGVILAYEFEQRLGLDLYADMMWRRLVVCAGGVMVTLALWMVLRLFDRSRIRVQIMAALIFALPGAVLIAHMNQLIFMPMERHIGAALTQNSHKRIPMDVSRNDAGGVLDDGPRGAQTPVPGLPSAARQQAETPGQEARENYHAETALDSLQWMALLDLSLSRYLLLLVWASLYFTILAAQNARLAEREGARYRSAARAAELRSLRYQVNPHFLFNALNSLSALVITGRKDRAEDMIQALSDFYRHSLTDGMISHTTLEDEFALQARYLEIEAIRFPDRLKAEFHLPEELATLRVPGMILQPLVENAVKYGVSGATKVVTISICAAAEGDNVLLSVCDDGPMAIAAQNPKPSGGFGIGLTNIRDRLHGTFGAAAKLSSGYEDGRYCTRILLPMANNKERT